MLACLFVHVCVYNYVNTSVLNQAQPERACMASLILCIHMYSMCVCVRVCVRVCVCACVCMYVCLPLRV